MLRIARSTTCWAVAGLASFALAGNAQGHDTDSFFLPTTRASQGETVALSDAALAQLRGGHAAQPQQPAKGTRKRVVLWDEARTGPAPIQLEPNNTIVIRGSAGFRSLPRGTFR